MFHVKRSTHCRPGRPLRPKLSMFHVKHWATRGATELDSAGARDCLQSAIASAAHKRHLPQRPRLHIWRVQTLVSALM